MIAGQAAGAASIIAVLAAAFLAALPASDHPTSPDVVPWIGANPPAIADPDAAGAAGPETRPSDDGRAGRVGAMPQAARIESYTILVGGERADGLVALPAGTPTTLAVFAHPWGGEAEDYEGPLLALAEEGVLAVAMDFRGHRDAFKVQAGVEDTVAATLELQADYPSVERTLLYGHSMGGEVAVLAVAAAPAGTYDYVFSGAGVSDLEALWHSFVMVRPAIEHETGGTPAEVPAAYDVRSPVDRIADLLDRGVARYFLVHGAGDAPVPVDHAERLYDAMSTAGLPVSYYVVTTDDDPWCIPVLDVCPDPAPPALASHHAGRYPLMEPFVEHRIDRLPDPDEQAVRGTYDGDSGTYEPSDVGDD